MNRRSAWLIALLVVATLAAGAGAFGYFFKPVTELVPLPAKGEASYNPLYALRQSLKVQGIKASSYPSLNPTALVLAPGDTLVLFTQPEAITPMQAKRLLAWVRDGGHLVMPGPELGESPGALADGLDLSGRPDPDHVEGDDWDRYCSRIDSRAKPLNPGYPSEKYLLCENRFTSSAPGFQPGEGDAKRGYRFARISHGQGVVTVSDLRFLDNDNLATPASREIAFQILSPRLGKGAVHLVYSADIPSLWRLLAYYGWPVLVPALLALAAWLLMRGQRFGPLAPMPAGHRRALLEHVQAAGEFAFRRGRGIALHTAVLNLFKQRLARREPMLAALDGEAQVMALSERLLLDAQSIRLALRPQGMQRPDHFLQSISTLVKMRNRL
jgi:hypothetical protein